MAVLGINCSGFHSSASLFVDGVLRAAICEERLSRVKQDKSFPVRAIRYCCDAAGIAFSDVTHAFVGWHPRYYIDRSDRTLFDALQNRGKLSYLALNELAAMSGAPVRDVSQSLSLGDATLAIHFVDHHAAHAASVFYPSGFESADVLVLDGFGEHTCGLAATMDAGGLHIRRTYPTPHSLGLFYAAFTDFLGFRPYSDEWKVMALASLGDRERYYPSIRSLIQVDGLGFHVDLSYFEYHLPFTPRLFARRLCELLGEPVERGAEPTQRDYDIVAAVQRVVEETTFALMNELQRETNGTRIVLAGGFFMNSVLNGKVLERTPYREVFVGGSPDDTGISMGAGFHGLRNVLEQPIARPCRHNYFGRSYGDDEILAELRRRKLRFTELQRMPSAVAGLIRDGRIVALFQGGSEFGQRALGNRSILADPTRADVKDLVNATVKYREAFRPFAPAVLEERQADVFEGGERQTSHYMERVLPFRAEWRSRVPGVVHFDGTGRLQTVSRTSNPAFHAIIGEFEQLSGVPLVLNTSLNINGMPLVETPGDAIDCFYQSGLDALVLQRYLLEK
jgi:carbamoyltransferase